MSGEGFLPDRPENCGVDDADERFIADHPEAEAVAAERAVCVREMKRVRERLGALLRGSDDDDDVPPIDTDDFEIELRRLDEAIAMIAAGLHRVGEQQDG